MVSGLQVVNDFWLVVGTRFAAEGLVPFHPWELSTLKEEICLAGQGCLHLEATACITATLAAEIKTGWRSLASTSL